LTQTFLHSKLFPCIQTADHTFPCIQTADHTFGNFGFREANLRIP
jgi:hypothetical protein